MTIDEKIIEYKDQFTALRDLSPHGYEVYRWMIALGRKLQDDPLSKEKRTEENKVSRCQFSLFVDKEDGRFKAWSDAMIASGYAYMLLDIFNSTGEEAKDITANSFEELDIGNLMSMNRQNGFYQMIGMMKERI